MAKRFDDRPGGDRRPNNRSGDDRNDAPRRSNDRPGGDRRSDGQRPSRPTGNFQSRPSRPGGSRPTGNRPGGFPPRRDGDSRDGDSRGPRREGGNFNERPSFPRKPYGSSRPEGDRFSRPGGDRRPGPERPGSGPRKPYGAKPAFGRKPDFNGDDRRGNDRRPSGSNFRRDDQPDGGDNRRFGNGPRNDDRRGNFQRDDSRQGDGNFRDKKPYTPRPFDANSRPSFDKKRFDTGDRPQGAQSFKKFGERKFGEKPAFGRKPDFNRSDRRDDDRRDSRPSGGNFRRDDRPQGDKPPFRPGGDRPAPRRDGEGFAPRKPLFKSRSPRDEADGRTPSYDFDRFKENAPKRIQKKIKDEERDTIRLNRYIANAGVCSRRDADNLIESGEVKVNGNVITEMGYQVKPGDVVKYGSRTLNPEKMLYVLLNKPKDFITTTDDPNDRRTVMDLVKNAGPQRIYPVGRLDRNTTGLLLLTNDGELASKLTHPSFEIRKMYQAELDKPISTEDFEKLKAGVELEDGFIKPDDLAIVTPDAQVVGIEIHSGRNRIVRRMFEALGYEVTKLDRTVYASLDKKDLPRGNWRFLTEKEVIKLKYF